jgi:hypothetical protein
MAPVCPIASDLDKATAQYELGPPSARKRDRSEDCSVFDESEKKDLILCTESLKSGLTESADGSMAKDTESLHLTARSRHVGLTNSAFSWKFGCRIVRDSGPMRQNFLCRESNVALCEVSSQLGKGF